MKNLVTTVLCITVLLFSCASMAIKEDAYVCFADKNPVLAKKYDVLRLGETGEYDTDVGKKIFRNIAEAAHPSMDQVVQFIDVSPLDGVPNFSAFVAKVTVDGQSDLMMKVFPVRMSIVMLQKYCKEHDIPFESLMHYADKVIDM